MTPSYLECPNKMVSAANGVDHAFREFGDGALPLVLLQHFRGNLDYWDPALIDALAVRRRVIPFDNAGVGSSSGTTPNTVTQMARDAIAFLAAIDLDQVDILGYSLGSFIGGHHGAGVVRDIDVQSGVHLLTGVNSRSRPGPLLPHSQALRRSEQSPPRINGLPVAIGQAGRITTHRIGSN